MKALIAEDDRKTASYLQRGLQECGYTVDLAYDGQSAFELGSVHSYDLYIFDVMLPYLSGFELLKKLRSFGKTSHAIFLTAKDQLQDKITGLELGADSYIVKPFSFSELIAIIRSLQRRAEMSQPTPSSHDGILELSDLRIDQYKHTAHRQNRLLDLTPIEFKLLTLLARNHDKVLTRTMILEQVWDVHFESNTNVVDVHIKRLRAKLDTPFPTSLIKTIRGVGYCLETQTKVNT